MFSPIKYPSTITEACRDRASLPLPLLAPPPAHRPIMMPESDQMVVMATGVRQLIRAPVGFPAHILGHWLLLFLLSFLVLARTVHHQRLCDVEMGGETLLVARTCLLPQRINYWQDSLQCTAIQVGSVGVRGTIHRNQLSTL